MVQSGADPVYFRCEAHAGPDPAAAMASSAKRRAPAEHRRQDDDEEDDMEEEMEGDDDEEDSDDIEDDESEEDEEVNEEVNVDFEAHTMSDSDHDGIKKLLKQVEAHPVLWDTSDSGYNDRQLKDEAWNTVCRSLRPNWDGLPEKQQEIIESDMKNKWRLVLNKFIQELAVEQQSSAFSLSKRKPYVYRKEMMFLTTSGEILQANLDAEPELLQAVEKKKAKGPAKKSSAPAAKGSKRKGKKNSVVILPPPPPKMRKRRVVRSRAYISEQVDAGILTLLQTKAAEDSLHNFGRVVATQVRRLPLNRRADFMAFALNSVEFFLPPYTPPAVDALVSSLRVVCTERAGSSHSDRS
ncbi:BRCA2 and CDKN1A-interacting protein isoform X1 [Engystomops pustulosus]|uniref:BRCA2 and CDKN1A-interacting protein isoform X1 n=1 Tax=Engystomops pustulosus TaxID=76066 RepID=UPI003AFA5AD6